MRLFVATIACFIIHAGTSFVTRARVPWQSEGTALWGGWSSMGVPVNRPWSAVMERERKGLHLENTRMLFLLPFHKWLPDEGTRTTSSCDSELHVSVSLWHEMPFWGSRLILELISGQVVSFPSQWLSTSLGNSQPGNSHSWLCPQLIRAWYEK